MILTKDNLLRYVCEKKYVTPTIVAETFDTTTMIASAALSGLSKEKLIAITYLKLSSTPYYYDTKQPECLVEIGDKHLKSHEKDVFLKLKQQQIINDMSLPIPQRLAIERLKDFANPIEIQHEEKHMKFWVWYLRDIEDTRKQINEALAPQTKPSTQNSIPTVSKPVQENTMPVQKIVEQQQKTLTNMKPTQTNNPFEVPEEENNQESKIDTFIKEYFKQNYLKVEGKNSYDKYTKYKLVLKINKIEIKLDAIYFVKKPSDTDILKFYTSSNKPKIVFIENAAKKYFKLGESLENLEIINI